MTTKKEHPGWVTAEDVARRAGVSRSAVSRTFTDGASVSPDTRAKVQRAAEELGYQVNMLARSMIQRQSNLVGVVVAGFQNPFLMSLLGPLTHQLALRAQAPLLMDASEPEQISASLQHLMQYRIAGVILTSGTPPLHLAKEYVRLHIPVAMINREPTLAGVDVVNSDSRQGGKLAAEALRRAGATKLAFLNIPTSTHSARERGDAFARALAGDVKRGVVTLRRVDAPSPAYGGGFEAARTLLADPANRPDGVFCVNDALACGLIDGARGLHGLRVPQELNVVGFDDVPMAGYAGYGLTTLRQDIDSLAREAVACLANRMVAPDAPAHTGLVPVSLVARGSCVDGGLAAPAAPDAAPAVRLRQRTSRSG